MPEVIPLTKAHPTIANNKAIILVFESFSLKHIIDNLLSNATKYSPQGAKIIVRTLPNQLQIFNSGVWIEEELLPHIFEPFVTGNKNIKNHGLGLYIVSY